MHLKNFIYAHLENINRVFFISNPNLWFTINSFTKTSFHFNVTSFWSPAPSGLNCSVPRLNAVVTSVPERTISCFVVLCVSVVKRQRPSSSQVSPVDCEIPSLESSSRHTGGHGWGWLQRIFNKGNIKLGFLHLIPPHQRKRRAAVVVKQEFCWSSGLNWLIPPVFCENPSSAPNSYNLKKRLKYTNQDLWNWNIVL